MLTLARPVDHFRQLVLADPKQRCRASGLDVQPQESLGVLSSQIDVPIGEFEAKPVKLIHRDGAVRIPGADIGHEVREIGDAEIERARGRMLAPHLGNLFAQGSSGTWRMHEDQQHGDQPAVAVQEVADIMVRRHLVAVAGIVLAMGGEIAVDSEPGEGRFCGSACRLENLGIKSRRRKARPHRTCSP
jgi:hypothetical protein